VNCRTISSFEKLKDETHILTHMLIELTENAINKVKEVALSEKIAPIIRAGIKGGGCAGYSYDLHYEEEEHITDTDQVVEFNEVKVVVDMMSLTYIEGTTIDYIEGLMGAGFKFINPSASNTCGCGSSFS